MQMLLFHFLKQVILSYLYFYKIVLKINRVSLEDTIAIYGTVLIADISSLLNPLHRLELRVTHGSIVTVSA